MYVLVCVVLLLILYGGVRLVVCVWEKKEWGRLLSK